jgi:hypothetical protein
MTVSGDCPLHCPMLDFFVKGADHVKLFDA